MNIKISSKDINNFNEDDGNNLKKAIDFIGQKLSVRLHREAFDKGFILIDDGEGYYRLEVPNASIELNKRLKIILNDLILKVS